MVCSICKRAGQYNAEGDINGAVFQHNKCEYPESCPCQHATGSNWINPEMVKKSES